MQDLLDKVLANPLFLAIGVILIVVLIYSIFKRLIKLLIFLVIAALAWLAYVYYTGDSVKEKVEDTVEQIIK
jgi:ABC-type transport system involved in cytochrome c biogenesis permease subunit